MNDYDILIEAAVELEYTANKEFNNLLDYLRYKEEYDVRMELATKVREIAKKMKEREK